MQSVNKIVEIIQRELRQLRSPLADFGKTSNLYVLLRSIASVISEQFYLLETSKLQTSMITATGDYLDLKAAEFGLTRKGGTPGEGWVLAKSINQKVRLPKSTVLTTVEGEFQFRTLAEVDLDLFEIAIPIQSLELDSSVNLAAGTTLFSPLFSQAQFEIGKYREVSSQKAQIGIQNGKSKETDSEFRNRMILYIRGLSKINSVESILSQIQTLPFITKVFIEEHFPVAGYFTIYTNTQKADEVAQIESLLNEIKPLGVNFLIKPIKELAVNVSLGVTVVSGTDSTRVLNQIRTSISDYFQYLSLNQNLDSTVLKSLVLKIPEVKEVQVESPFNLTVPPAGGIIVLNNLTIKLNI